MIYTFLSPHLDDAVLSCGGRIHRHAAGGEIVRVVTLFAGEPKGGATLPPFAKVQHGYWGNPPRPMALRRAEDKAALALLGADLIHHEHLDAVYRASPSGQWLYPSEEAIFGPVNPRDPATREGAEGLARQLDEGVPPQSKDHLIFAPLALGGHVDHQITHMAALQLSEMGHSVAFYEDYPYAERLGDSKATSGAGWSMENLSLGAADLEAKVAALCYYRTQLQVLFGGPEDMPGQVRAFASTRSPEVKLAERIYWPGQPLHA